MTIDDTIRITVTCTAVVAWLYFVPPHLPLLAMRVFEPPARIALALGSYGVHVTILCMASVSGYVLLTDPDVVYCASMVMDSLFDALVRIRTVGASILAMCSDFAFFCASRIGI
jgi:hypothetical protein